MRNVLHATFAAAAALAAASAGAAVINLTGTYTTGYEYAATEDTTVNLNGVRFTDCTLKLTGDKTFTINLVEGTQNVFTMDNDNKELIKATKNSSIVFTGTGSAELTSTKRITDGGKPSGIIVCNDLTVEGGDIEVTFDQNKSDTSCIFVKGNYRQTGGRVKVDMAKKNCTNEFAGVHLDGKNTTFTLEGGEFKAEIAGTKSRAIDLRKTCTAVFRNCDVSAKFEGPSGRFVSGGTIIFESGEYDFKTNVTSKMTSAYHPTDLSAVKADYSITVAGGDFEADLPLAGSEVFTTDSETGTFVAISGGDLDLVAGNDCVHANGDVEISGGRIRAVSVFDDALDANGGMTISGGDIRAYATASGTHGLDVNKGSRLTIEGGIVVATDGIGAIKLGTSGSTEVGKTTFSQAAYYGTLPAAGYSEKYLALEGATNGVPFSVKTRLPAFPAGDFNLLVSLPGRAASEPAPATVGEAYSDANSRTPLVFEEKASLSDHTLVTKAGDVLQIPAHYDVAPASGKSKTFSLSLNELATPVFSDSGSDGVPPIAVDGDEVRVGVRTREGLSYWLVASDSLAANAVWTPAGATNEGTGAATSLVCTNAGPRGFYRVKADD